MTVASVADLHRRAVAGERRRRGLRPGDPGPVRPAAPDQLPRPDPVRGVDRARRDPRRQPPVPVLRPRPDPVHDRDHRRARSCSPTGSGSSATAWGAVAGAAAHLGDPGDRHDLRTSFRIRPGFAIRTAGVPRVRPADDPADVLSHPIEPLIVHLLHASSPPALGGRRRLGAQLRARLPGRAGQPHRRRRSRWRSSRSCRRPTPTATGRRSGRSSAGTSSRSAVLTTLAGDRPVRPVRDPRRGPARRRQVRPRTTSRVTSAVVAAFALSVPFDALAYPLSRGLYATHDTIRQVIASFAGLGVVVARHDAARARRRDPRRSRSATRPAWPSRTSCWRCSWRRGSGGSAVSRRQPPA